MLKDDPLAPALEAAMNALIQSQSDFEGVTPTAAWCEEELIELVAKMQQASAIRDRGAHNQHVQQALAVCAWALTRPDHYKRGGSGKQQSAASENRTS